MNKWKYISCLWIKRLIKMEILPKIIYKFNTTPIKIAAAFKIIEIDKLILKLYVNLRVPD